MESKKLGVAMVLTAALIVGCDDGAGETMATDGATDGSSVSESTDSGDGTSGGECNPGYESCACVDGDLCLAGLTCVSNVCVDLGDVTSGGDSDSGDSDSKGSDTTEPTEPEQCVSNDDCAVTEVCSEGFCGDTDFFFFEITVDRFDPPDCLDGWGSAEIFYDYYMDGVFQGSSTEAGCPGEWPTEILDYDSLQDFRLAFWEADAFEDDFIVSLCWGDPCGPIPKEVLHDGGWSGTDLSGDYYMELTIDVAAGYGG